MCDVTTIDRGNRGRVLVEFERRADFGATEVFVINQGPGDDPIETGVSLICTDTGKILNIEQLPMREPRGILPEPPPDLKKEIRETWERVKAISFFTSSVNSKCSDACKKESNMCEIVRMDRLVKE